MNAEEKKIYMHQWCVANRERTLAVRRRYYQKNSARICHLSREEQRRNGNRPARLETKRKYRVAHKERTNVTKRLWRHNNRDVINRKRREWLSRNPGKETEYLLRYKAKNPERFKVMHRATYMRRKDRHAARAKIYRAEKKELIAATRKAWAAKNAEKIKANRIKYRHLLPKWRKENPERAREISNRRRARKSSGWQDCTAKMVELGLKRFCHYCCVQLTTVNRTVDHVTSLARGGIHQPDNLVAACKSCNSSKGSKLLSEWTWRMAA